MNMLTTTPPHPYPGPRFNNKTGLDPISFSLGKLVSSENCFELLAKILHPLQEASILLIDRMKVI